MNQTALYQAPSVWPAKDLQDLKSAVQRLEHPGWAIRLINFLGAPIEALIRILPRPLSLMIRWLTERALGKSLELAISTLGKRAAPGAWIGTHRGLLMASGALGGFWGLPGLLVELPVSTVLLFVSHFQAMASGHFIIRRLERQYGPEAVRREYQRLAGLNQRARDRK